MRIAPLNTYWDDVVQMGLARLDDLSRRQSFVFGDTGACSYFDVLALLVHLDLLLEVLHLASPSVGSECMA
jgi:hypothetical protein